MQKNAEKEMPFLDHLEELRQRLFWVLGALIVAVMAGFAIVFNFDVMGFLQSPIQPYLPNGALAFTSPLGPFKAMMAVSLVLGVVLALPVIVYHAWGFLSPGLLPREKKLLAPVLASGTLLFLLGVTLSFAVILPISLRFLLSLGSKSFVPMITVEGYYGLAIPMSLAFGAMFELPMVVLVLASLGIVTPIMLHKFRRYAVVILLIVCAIVTPDPSPLALMLMFAPIYLLYEISVVITHVVFRRRAKRLAAQEAEAIG